MSLRAEAMVKRPRPRALLDCPDEILTSVFSLMIEDYSWRGSEILNFRLACRRLHEVSESTSYRYVFIGRAYAYKRLLRSFSARQQRQNYVQSLKVTLLHTRYNDKCPLTTGLVIDFANVKSLDIRLDITPRLGTQDWRDQLQSQLNTNHFSRLREASLDLQYPDELARKCTLHINALLQAPTLTKLSLFALDLRQVSVEDLPDHKTCLKELCLKNCQITEISLSALVAAPAALATFKITAGNPDSHPPLSQLPVGRELEILRHTITILAAKQRCLTKLTIDLCPRPPPSSQTGNALEIGLSKLPPLKELCISAGNWAHWFPMSPFFDLPVCEVLKLQMNRCSSLEEIALSHLELRRQTNLTEVPPRHLEIIAWDHPNLATDKEQQQRDEKLRHGIGMFMTHLQLEQLTYHQNGREYRKVMFARLGDSSATGEYLFDEKAYECKHYGERGEKRTLISHTSELRQQLPK